MMGAATGQRARLGIGPLQQALHELRAEVGPIGLPQEPHGAVVGLQTRGGVTPVTSGLALRGQEVVVAQRRRPG